jgi:glycosyltransferase involved in cell wall biosynthesis
MHLEKIWPISVTMIARNGEALLPLSLGSVQAWVQEMIVVVNDCSDRTVAVAREYGAVVHEHAWTNRRDQKNIALSYATQPWVLALDMDEAVTFALRQQIEGLIKMDPSDVAGVDFPRKTWFLNRWITHGDWYPDYSLRLFRRDRAYWGGSSEHDKIVLDGRKHSLSGELLHYSFPTIMASIDKIPAFAEAFAREQHEAGRKWSGAETIFRTVWRFLRSYFLRRGFLDGYPGFYIAVTTALYTFVRYSKLYEIEHGKKPPRR